MPPSRRVWCSCVILDYLKGESKVQAQCELIIEAGERGETEILVSALAECEVARIDPPLTDDAEAMIREFFGRPYVVRVVLDPPIAEIARELVRTYGLKGADAAHVATALHWNVPVFETTDGEVLRKLSGTSGRVLGQPLTVREPLWEGQRRMDDLFRLADQADGGTPPQ